MNTQIIKYSLSLGVAVAFSAPVFADDHVKVDPDDFQRVIDSSFKAKGQATLDRLEQSTLQKACSSVGGDPSLLHSKVRARLEKEAMDSVVYPADGNYLGDWKAGEKIAQSGKGLQWSDDPSKPAGGNCYACHQITAKEISYGNIGPSLASYGKTRGNSEEIMKYTWARIWNSHAFNACNNMPRFGAAGILTEQQIKDVMALLLSPDSPVNK